MFKFGSRPEGGGGGTGGGGVDQRTGHRALSGAGLANRVLNGHCGHVMKLKTGIIVLVVVAIGLLIALFATKKQADDQRAKDAAAILEFPTSLTRRALT